MSKSKSKGEVAQVVLGSCVVGVVVVWVVYTVVVYVAMSEDPAGRGQFGDSFGGLNALFTGFTFVLLGLSVWIQRKDFNETVKEIRDQTEANQKLAENSDKQVKIAAIAACLQAHTNTLATLQRQNEQLTEKFQNVKVDRRKAVFADWKKVKERMGEEKKYVDSYLKELLKLREGLN